MVSSGVVSRERVGACCLLQQRRRIYRAARARCGSGALLPPCRQKPLLPAAARPAAAPPATRLLPASAAWYCGACAHGTRVRGAAPRRRRREHRAAAEMSPACCALCRNEGERTEERGVTRIHGGVRLYGGAGAHIWRGRLCALSVHYCRRAASNVSGVSPSISRLRRKRRLFVAA